ncbi:uncharacterized protein LOC117565622 isoform X1 [Drosophila albomicans]|uniref:Uncharacterized protein LOC117565622 isoform X1 n=1 Tax=Drosophila albomicans TaxID=7291 RepID=A0A6P8WAL6_DROAB|nr:uncharacterized protein LOC117565622 isoform X1 [Drosophila albomicans]
MSSHNETYLTAQLKEHFDKEEEVLNILVNLEQAFREIYKYFQCEMQKQMILIERLWLLTQRYLILISSVPGCRYPQVYTLSAEEAIINEYEEKIEILRAATDSMQDAILNLKQDCKQFNKIYNQLNKRIGTPLIMGDEHHQSIQCHKIMITDIFNYFYSTVLKIKCYVHQLDPINLESVEDYRELLKKETEYEDFQDYLMHSFVYCKCLQSRPTCPIQKLKCYHKIETLKHTSRI